MRLRSDAFSSGERIPIKYAADGDNVSPPLGWSDVPDGARELALLLEDVKTTGERRYTHWVIYGIDPDRGGLPEGLFHQREPERAPGAVQGTNSQGNVGYNGPQVPIGSAHHYRFRLLALDQPTNLAPGADRQALERAIEGHVVAEAEIEATYERPR